jgi:transcriptional regulator with XRE-family HTH domain
MPKDKVIEHKYAKKIGRPCKYSDDKGNFDINKLIDAIDTYFDTNDVYSAAGLRVELGVSAQTIDRWEKGIITVAENEEEQNYIYELGEAIKKAYDIIERYLIENTGKNTIKDIAALNRSHGYRDTKQIDHTISGNINLGILQKHSD